jgi:hypothetical protein
MTSIPTGKPLVPTFAFVHEKEWTEDLLSKILQPKVTCRLAAEGNVGLTSHNLIDGIELQEEILRKEIRLIAANKTGGLFLVPHVLETPGEPLRRLPFKRPFVIWFGLDASREFVDYVYGRPIQPLPVFSSTHLRFAVAHIMDSDSRPSNPLVSRLFVEECHRILELLDASFGFGGDLPALRDPGITDPRSRVWGVTYYGPKLAQEIGLERLKTAPAHKVEVQEDGGVWLYLDELPLVPSPQVDARKDAVEQHLGLRERFPNTGAQGA